MCKGLINYVLSVFRIDKKNKEDRRNVVTGALYLIRHISALEGEFIIFIW